LGDLKKSGREMRQIPGPAYCTTSAGVVPPNPVSCPFSA
jgi:hypothetical protein